ncbi:hypothetical protein ACVWZL_005988 [Bradyrhizobium sp. GM2.4]
MVKHVQAARSAGHKRKRFKRYKNKGDGVMFAGRKYAPFVEKFEHEDGTPAPAMRSWLGIMSMSLFNSSLSKVVAYGLDKTTEYRDAERIFALDNSHVVLDRARRCAFVVDLDGWWPDLATLRAVLRKLLPPEFMPNSISYRGREEDGAGVENPHLAWLLPPGARVLRGKNKQKQIKLHEMIQCGIVSHLIPVGADPGHTNSFKTKCPLAPGWSVECCDDYFQTMNQWRSFLPTITPDRREMMRRAKVIKAAGQAGVEVSLSDAIWHDGVAARSIEIASAQARKDPAYLSAVRKSKIAHFADWLYHPADGVVTQRLVGQHGDTRAVRSVIAAQRQFVIDVDMTPAEVDQFCDRGRDAAANADLAPLPHDATKEQRKERELLLKHLARQRTQAFKEAVHRGLIAEEIESRLSSGVPVVKAEVVKALVGAGTVGRSTAYAMFDDVFEVVQRTARYQVHSSATETTQVSQPVEQPPVVHQNVTVQASGPTTSSDLMRDPAKNHRRSTACLGRRRGYVDRVRGGLPPA